MAGLFGIHILHRRGATTSPVLSACVPLPGSKVPARFQGSPRLSSQGEGTIGSASVSKVGGIALHLGSLEIPAHVEGDLDAG